VARTRTAQIAAELAAPGEVECLERGEPSQLWREASQEFKVSKKVNDTSADKSRRTTCLVASVSTSFVKLEGARARFRGSGQREDAGLSSKAEDRR
jgi:hypothetical protein